MMKITTFAAVLVSAAAGNIGGANAQNLRGLDQQDSPYQVYILNNCRPGNEDAIANDWGDDYWGYDDYLMSGDLQVTGPLGLDGKDYVYLHNLVANTSPDYLEKAYWQDVLKMTVDSCTYVGDLPANESLDMDRNNIPCNANFQWYNPAWNNWYSKDPDCRELQSATLASACQRFDPVPKALAAGETNNSLRPNACIVQLCKDCKIPLSCCGP